MGGAHAEEDEVLHGGTPQLLVAETPAVFGAPFGVKWDGGVHMVVAIRCVIWEGDRLALPSGCGIVGASDQAAEWRELALKRSWVKGALGLG